jgi:hypothetical protein
LRSGANSGWTPRPTALHPSSVTAKLGANSTPFTASLLGSNLGSGNLDTATLNIDEVLSVAVPATVSSVLFDVEVVTTVTGAGTGVSADFFGGNFGVRLLSIETTMPGLMITSESGFNYNTFIPEPASFALVGIGGALLLGRARRV